jgi:PPM family protein phosphatase
MDDIVWTAAGAAVVFVVTYFLARRSGRARDLKVEKPEGARVSLAPDSARASLAPDSGRASFAPIPTSAASQPTIPQRTSAAPPSAPAKVAAKAAPTASGLPSLDISLPNLSFEEDADVEPTRVGEQSRVPPTTPIVYDADAEVDEETQPRPLILVTASAQTDKGIRRKRNEDSVLVAEDKDLFVVADGMGGYSGGQIASQLAVQTIASTFSAKHLAGPRIETIPPRASELALAIQKANDAILATAKTDSVLEGMGTTVCAAHFSKHKQRLYIGHVGDSRIYRYRDARLQQMTSDHTMKDFGVEGDGSAHLSRAVGVWPTVSIDIILGKPRVGDLYLLCSDGLTKMVSDERIEEILRTHAPSRAVEELVKAANEQGGKDNISVIVIRVDSPRSAAA